MKQTIVYFGSNSRYTLKLGTLNVCGFKRKSLYPEFFNTVAKYNIFGVVETKFDENDMISLHSYEFIDMPRTKDL